MKRMNLRDVPDDVYDTLMQAAANNRQSLNAFIIERLAEMAQVEHLNDYIADYPAPQGTGVTLDDAAAAIRQVREAS